MKNIICFFVLVAILSSCQMSAKDCACKARAMMTEAMSLDLEDDEKLSALENKFSNHIAKCEELYTAEELHEAGKSCD
jgi:hypothetical protein